MSDATSSAETLLLRDAILRPKTDYFVGRWFGGRTQANHLYPAGFTLLKANAKSENAPGDYVPDEAVLRRAAEPTTRPVDVSFIGRSIEALILLLKHALYNKDLEYLTVLPTLLATYGAALKKSNLIDESPWLEPRDLVAAIILIRLGAQNLAAGKWQSLEGEEHIRGLIIEALDRDATESEGYLGVSRQQAPR